VEADTKKTALRVRQFLWARAIDKKLIMPDHAWEVVGLAPADWAEHERLGAGIRPPGELLEGLRDRYKILATPAMLSYRAAWALWQELEKRRVVGLSSPRQVYFLKLENAGDETTPAKEAERIFEKLWGKSQRERQKQQQAQQEQEGKQQKEQQTEKRDDWLQHFIDGTPDEKAEPTHRFFSLDDD
jgi:hypothetical protein